MTRATPTLALALLALACVAHATPGPDCNGNGVPDDVDILNGAPDCDGNGVPDECDIADGAADFNGNGIPDVCEGDCNGNGLPDFIDIGLGLSADCDGNDVPDECDLADGAPDCDGNGILDACDVASGAALDCNANGVPDACDVADGTSPDYDGDGVPDECKPDCDGDGLPDFIEILIELDTDCDRNGVPDACDLADGAADCDDDGVIDTCQISEPIVVDLGVLGPVVHNAPFVVPLPRLPRAHGDVLITAEAVARVETNSRRIAFRVNGAFQTYLFQETGLACPALSEDAVVRARAFFNDAIELDPAGTTIRLEPNTFGPACSESWVHVVIAYDGVLPGDANEDGVLDACECDADIVPTGVVDLDDLLLLLMSWGPCTCEADLDGDGIADFTDLLALLSAWGSCT